MKKLLLICIMLLLISLPCFAMAAEEPTECPIPVFEAQEGPAVDRSAAHTNYARQVMGLSSSYTSRDGLAWLTDAERPIYLKCRDWLMDVAAGRKDSSAVPITIEDLGMQDKYFPEEVGLTTFRDVDGNVMKADVILSYVRKVMPIDIYDSSITNSIMWAVVRDLPLQCYWFGNKVGLAGSAMMVGIDQQGRQYLSFPYGVIDLCFIPSASYSVPDHEWRECILNTNLTGIADKAVTRANQIIKEAANKSDIDKLIYYVTSIRALSEYNEDASQGSFMPWDNSGPWEIIYVFDGDPETKVVCEGYAKAFQYLIQNSSFLDRTLECYCMSGKMGISLDNMGDHVWNIIVNKAGQYLVDVTNCTLPLSYDEKEGTGRNLFMDLPQRQEDNVAKFGIVYYKYDEFMKYLPNSVKIYCKHAQYQKIETEPVEPGCVTPGTTGGMQCSYCSAVLEKAEVLPDLGGHIIITEDAVEATCTEPGVTEGSYCERCGEVLEEQKPVKALGHDEEVLEQIHPTVYSDGCSEGITCKRCGEVLLEPHKVLKLTWDNDLELPKNLTTIGNEAFKNVNAQVIEVPVTVKTIGSHAFSGKRLREIMIYNGGVTMAEDAFADLDKDTTVFFAARGSTAAKWLRDRGYIVILEEPKDK